MADESNPSVLKALLWAAAAFVVWNYIAFNFIWPPKPKEPGDEQQQTAGRTVDDVSGQVAPASIDDSTPGTDQPPAVANGLHVVPGTLETIAIGAVDEQVGGAHRILAEVSTVGGGVVRADLVDHDDSVAEDSPSYPMLATVEMPDGGVLRSYTTDRISLHLGEIQTEIELADVPWRVVSSDQGSITMAVDVHRGDKPVLRISKTFAIPEEPAEEHRYDMGVSLLVENLSGDQASVIITQDGAMGVRREDSRMDDRGLFVGVRESGYIEVSSQYQSSKDPAESMFKPEGGKELLWTAIANKYFVAFMTPLRSDGQPGADWIAEAKRVPLILDTDANTHVLKLVTKPLIIAAGGSRQLEIGCYLGPKSRKTFARVKSYSDREYGEQVLESYGMGPCAFMAFPSLTRFMIWLLNNIRVVVFNYGIAIIILVLIVRTVLHPITKRGQVQMMRVQQSMGSLQPRMAELKKKFPNDKARQSQEMMKIYQEERINPMTGMLSGCLPMFLQMPIWIALYTSLNYNVDMRHQPFFLWIHDLTAPDCLIPLGRVYDLPLMGATSCFNLLPILVCLSMFFQQKLMPRQMSSPGQSEEQAAQSAQMQKMMPYMSLVMGVIFYNMPSGLNLYIAASSTFGMIEQKRIRAHIEDLKKLPPPTPKAKDPNKVKKTGWFAKLQGMAEEAQKNQAKGGKTRNKGKGRRG